MTRHLVLASILAWGGTAVAQEGTYRIAGSTVPDGKGGTSKTGYSGTVTIEKSDDVFTLKWQTSGGAYRGIGVKDGNRLIAAFGRGKDFGLVLFRRDGGSLTGDVKFGGDASKFGSEMVKGATGRVPSGSFDTMRMANGVPDFSGKIAFKPLGQTVQVTWSGEKRYRGVGIPQDELVPVAFGTGSFAGVIVYDISGDGAALKGTYAVQGEGTLFLETLRRE